MNKAPSTPQSLRKFDYADGLYFGGFLNGVPHQYIFFKESGIDVISTGEVYVKGTKIKLDAPVETTSTIAAKSDIHLFVVRFLYIKNFSSCIFATRGIKKPLTYSKLRAFLSFI
ncbi:hypothetical protein ACLSYX_02545 [[Pasteurella] aerogenes]